MSSNRSLLINSLLLLLLSCSTAVFGLAQQQNEMNVLARSSKEKSPDATKVETSPHKSIEERLAKSVLESAQTELTALEPASRSYVCYQAARGVIRYDRDGARQLLMQCFTASQAIEQKEEKGQLQGWIVERLLDFGPQAAEELMPQVEGHAREMVRAKLIDYYTKEKRFDDAIAQVNAVRPEEERFPYRQTADLIQALPEDRSGEAVSLFAQALADYKKRPIGKGGFSTEDMGTFVARFASRVPDSMLLEAIDEILRRAKIADEDQQKVNISISSEDKTASFTSNYEYRLFQVLPALRRLDPDRAEDLLKENQKMKSLIGQYPQGMASLDPGMGGKPQTEDSRSHMRFSVNTGGGGRSDFGDRERQRILVNQQIAELVKKATGNPKQSIAQALAFPGGEDDSRARALEGIARELLTKDPQMARNAIDELIKACDGLEYMQQENYLSSAVKMLLQLEEKDAARKVIEHGFELADKLYQQDSSASDPNKAAKVFWPASSMWQSFVKLAAEISPEFALQQIKEIQNQEIQVYEKVTLANAWLGVKGGLSMVREQKAHENSFMMNSEDH